MATIQELESALVNADKAGDTQAATVLARELKIAKGMRGKFFNDPSISSEQINAAPSPTARLGRGFMDLAQGTKQAALDLTDPAAAKEYTRTVDDEIGRYNKDRGANAGFDAMRFGGNVLASVPVAAALATAAPEAATASLMGRAALGGAQGAVQGGMEFTPEGQSKAKQIVFGGAGGAGGPVLGEIGARVAAKLTMMAQRGAKRLTTSPDEIVAAIQGELQQNGMDWNKLGAEVKTGLVQQARRQLAVSGELAPDQLARKLEMDDVLGPSAGGTQGQITRNPEQWTWERNTQKLGDGIGQPLTDRYAAQLQRLQQRLGDAIDAKRSNAQNEVQAGKAASEALKQKMDDSQRVVGDLYATWRESGAGDTSVKPQRIADELGRVIDDFGVENIPGAVRARMESFGLMGGKQTKELTINEAEKLGKLIGNNIDPRNAPSAAALGKLKRAVDGAVLDTDAPDIPSLQAAKAAARERFSVRDSSPAIEAAAEGAQPDKFFSKYVVNGNVEELRGLKAALNTGVTGAKPTPGMVDYEPAGGQAWRDLQAQTLRRLMDKAQASPEKFGTNLSKAMKEIGDERLKVIFEPEQFAALQKLERVANNVTTEPPFAAVNRANTAPTMMQYAGDVLKKIASIPGVRPFALPFVGAAAMGDQALKSTQLRSRVAQTLTGEAVDPTGASDQYARLVKMMADRMDPIASGAAVGGSLALTQ